MKRRSLRTARTAGPNGTPVAPNPAQNPAPNLAPNLAAATLGGAVLVLSLALSGCQVMSPIQTEVPYQPGDGVAVDVGDVHIRGLVVIAGAKDEVGTLSGMVVNDGSGPVTVSFVIDSPGVSAQVTIPAGTPTRLSGVDGAMPVTLPGIQAAPGDMIKVTVSTPAGGAPEVSVPVLLPTGYYATITPAPIETTTPAPVQTITPAPVQTTAP